MSRTIHPDRARGHSDAGRANASALVSLVAFAVLIGAGSCLPDLRETAGPRVPIPNVEGSVVRNGSPVGGLRVRLVITATDSTFAKTHTDAAGWYGFGEVGIGGWTVKVTSTDATDFATVEYPFTFARPDTGATIPPIDLALSGTSLASPADGDTAPYPGFIVGPLEFGWTRPAWPDSLQARVQVRLYDPSGSPVWYSAKIPFDTSVSWNGFCNQGIHINQPVDSVGPGPYSWRLRLDLAVSSLEFTTATRTLVLEPPQ